MANTTPILVASGAAASSGDNSIISAPGAGLKIVIIGFVIQNESGTATTMKLYNGVNTAVLARCLGQNQGDGLAFSCPPDARIKLTTNTALGLNLSGANSCGYTIWYYTE